MSSGPALILGWRELVDLPELGSTQVRCKVDTGAKTSALHAEDLELVRVRGRDMVRFRLAEALGAGGVELAVHEMRWVKSSNGQREHRPVVCLELVLGGVRWVAEITLTTRDGMGFPMLLGREALSGRFLIDPGRSFVQKPAKDKGTASGKKKASKKKASKKKASKKKASKKTASKKTAGKKTAGKKTAGKKTAGKKKKAAREGSR